MTDTNTTPTPATPNELLSENHDLLYKLLAVIENHVNELVERKVAQIFQSHATMALIDEKTEERLREIADDAIGVHESDFEHHSTDDISDTVATHIHNHDWSHNIKRSVEEILSDGDYCTEERAQELAQDAIYDIDWTDKVKEGLRGMCE